MAEENEKLIQAYFKEHYKYARLAENIKASLEEFLHDQNIHYLHVDARVKKLNDFLEKIHRKGYKKPFIEMNDICGLRIICYFSSDIQKISKLIKKEFNVVETVNKGSLENPTQFGYKSEHYIVKIKDEWLNTPNYRNLKDINFEIQVRTILMHAWAEIEHKLAYKKFAHMPSQFRRKFSRLSAKLEEADEQFEEIMKNIISYRNSDSHLKKDDSPNQINLDNLISLLENRYPKSRININEVRDNLDSLQDLGISIFELNNLLDKENAEGNSRKDIKIAMNSFKKQKSRAQK